MVAADGFTPEPVIRAALGARAHGIAKRLDRSPKN